MAKLGSKKNPIVCRLQSADKVEDIIEQCESHGWEVIVGVEPDKPEDISDLQRALNRLEEEQTPKAIKVGRNEPCPCGSGKKYKKCCGAVGL